MSVITIIGGGIVGLATAWKAQGRFPERKVIVLEKETEIGRHQTGNNSGVLHCGLYYKPGSFKAKMAVSGIRQMVQFCEEEGIPHEVCGKLVVATNEVEEGRLDHLEKRGRANGLKGIRRMTGEEMREREPHVGGTAALEVPEEGIVDYPAVCRSLAERIRENGGEIRTATKVTGLSRNGGNWRITCRGDELESGFLINCAGLHSDRVCNLSGLKSPAQIVPFRGEYYQLKPESRHLVNHLIYPVPDPAFPFLGVHFTRLIHGGVEAGPNAVLALAREGYRKTTVNPGDLAETLAFPGLWKFLGKYPGMCFQEIRQSLSKRLFCRALQKLVPSIRESDLEPGGAGVRAQAMSADGKLVEDFAFAEGEGIINVVNAPSPAATASLAIADEIVSRIPDAG